MLTIDEAVARLLELSATLGGKAEIQARTRDFNTGKFYDDPLTVGHIIVRADGVVLIEAWR